jgi:hypothetical protein
VKLCGFEKLLSFRFSRKLSCTALVWRRAASYKSCLEKLKLCEKFRAELRTPGSFDFKN